MATTDLEVVHTSLDSPEEDASWERGEIEGLTLIAHDKKWHRATLLKYAEVNGIADEPAIKALIESWPRVYGEK